VSLGISDGRRRLSLTPRFSEVVGEASGSSTVLTVFRDRQAGGKTVKTVLTHGQASDTLLKQGLNEISETTVGDRFRWDLGSPLGYRIDQSLLTSAATIFGAAVQRFNDSTAGETECTEIHTLNLTRFRHVAPDLKVVGVCVFCPLSVFGPKPAVRGCNPSQAGEDSDDPSVGRSNQPWVECLSSLRELIH
jgi:hypothetical protein